MEGSVATTGGTGTGAAGGGDGGEGGDGGAAPQVPGFDALAQTLEGVQSGQQELREMFSDLASQVAAPSGDDGGEDGLTAADLDLGFLDGDGAGEIDSAQLAERLQGLVDTRAQQLLDQRLGPIEQRVNDSERTRMYQDLVDDIPDFGDRAISNQVMQATEQMADAYGWPEELKQDPRMWRVVYLSARAIEAAREEGDGSDAGVATLEGGGGARPAGAGQEVDLGAEIVQARKGRGALPFS